MRKQRRFTAEFKREVVKELLSGTTVLPSYPGVQSLIRPSVSLEKTICKGKFDNEPT
jgi:transposase-like protein